MSRSDQCSCLFGGKSKEIQRVLEFFVTANKRTDLLSIVYSQNSFGSCNYWLHLAENYYFKSEEKKFAPMTLKMHHLMSFSSNNISPEIVASHGIKHMYLLTINYSF